ncbi:probable tRNA (uracil-O(2)-)-methyltransferase [Ostrinia nubilalis]|uniref:probable tRNA (uracil-O(2)-)-methyltransferase n=1 Tax=Ostrinia nubilalis TaxID=29057 RepID=UPI0030825C57
MFIQTSMSPELFWKSVNILITKFNVINKRLWGCNTIFSCCCKPTNNMWEHPKTCTKLQDKGDPQPDIDLLFKELQIEQCIGAEEVDACATVVVIELLPKLYSQKKAYQLILMEKGKELVTFYDITPEGYNQNLCPDFIYSLALENGILSLKTNLDNVSNSKSYQWLVKQVLPQFVKWGEEENVKKHMCTESLSLISTDDYYKKYNELKLKYGKEMVEIWPEVTDPSKFVYEDVAIATYLLLLWENGNEENRKKTFVDLGCGNGLLVYILTKEGHTGVGIDVRKRQIWDMYPDDVKLEIKTIIPSDLNLFPEADWLIGNHSDELTPWIPVIAARSSYKCNFFLLPCCAFNFDGSKYQRKDSSKSQYTEYLEYVKDLCVSCGFVTHVDRLKIPSTKRICLVGQKRSHTEDMYLEYCNDIKKLIDKSCGCTDNKASKSDPWVADFKARDPVERIRNCTKIDKGTIESMVNCIANYLLQGCNLETEWSCGRLVNLCELIHLLNEDQLKAMKAECGGLQTLLRNHHHIFKVQSGQVQLRYPKNIDEVSKNVSKPNKNIKVKRKSCWFYAHHPQGCPLIDSKCSYLHQK